MSQFIFRLRCLFVCWIAWRYSSKEHLDCCVVVDRIISFLPVSVSLSSSCHTPFTQINQVVLYCADLVMHPPSLLAPYWKGQSEKKYSSQPSACRVDTIVWKGCYTFLFHQLSVSLCSPLRFDVILDNVVGQSSGPWACWSPGQRPSMWPWSPPSCSILTPWACCRDPCTQGSSCTRRPSQ